MSFIERIATSGYATIALSKYQSAQGPVLRKLRDGRVVIDTGNGRLTGLPLNEPAPTPRAWLPLFAGF
ncbi:hypothetical protein [Paracoccus sulfuroxidans]|uniref:Uncharacterized protein n=1 Tax=Paracoccus sulfuroxidans TaxID=384678 RepID=A0A562NXU3_9RHOB|nr:hypothetical protein [Paracoccus sulfuroxidans]TWI36820.1 hypothetical protein IQ24_00603 [Paracoccus sulfuroxidans]